MKARALHGSSRSRWWNGTSAARNAANSALASATAMHAESASSITARNASVKAGVSAWRRFSHTPSHNFQ